MSYRTKWIPAFTTVRGPAQFIGNSLAYHCLKLLPMLFFGGRRAAHCVQSNYDADRKRLWARLESLSFDDYTLYPASMEDFIVLDDRLLWGKLREARLQTLERLVEYVKMYALPGASVAEFGSGDGRNLLYLKRRFPDMNFVGFELSPISVELSRAASRKFQIDGVSFLQANVCEPLPTVPELRNTVLCFSIHALEQMPRVFPKAVENMIETSSRGILFLEPAHELWRRDVRGLISRLRVFEMDRLRGLPGTLRDLESRGVCKILEMKRSKLAINPLNEMCELHVVKSS